LAFRLRAEGHDVAAVSERGADPGDAAIPATAVAEGRILVTIDADFGALVFRDGAKRTGVLRLRSQTAQAMAMRASELLDAYGDELASGAFVTDDGASARVTRA
jgi:predicted nuclease of predicted toxin-antitoxin system